MRRTSGQGTDISSPTRIGADIPKGKFNKRTTIHRAYKGVVGWSGLACDGPAPALLALAHDRAKESVSHFS